MIVPLTLNLANLAVKITTVLVKNEIKNESHI